jgi:virginiamycin A acetyltransferase
LKSLSTYPFPIFYEEWETKSKIEEAWDNKGDIVVGNDVWIGYEAIICAGAKIGDGAIIASRSIVKGEVPPYSIYGGAPARLIKKRFSDDIIDYLQSLKWWELEYRQIESIIPYIIRSDIDSIKSIIHKSNYQK